MSDDQCWHGNQAYRCDLCRMTRATERLNRIPAPPRYNGGGSGFGGGGETKQDVLNDVCDLLELPRQPVSRGSSLPHEIFQAAAEAVGVPGGTMPEVCEGVVRKAGIPYSSAYDSRGTVSGGGSTVTLEGIQAMRRALRALLV